MILHLVVLFLNKIKTMKSLFPKNSIKKVNKFVLFFSLVILNSSFKDTYTLKSSKFFLNENNCENLSSFTLEYSSTTFKAGSTGFSEAKVSAPGGVFTCQRLSSNQGDLSINKRTGKIDKQNSDPGEYIIEYKLNSQKATAKIIVLI